MGRLALRSGWLPKPLGWTLIAGGVGYIASAFTGSMFPNTEVAAQILTIPSIIGELWIMGYLIILGIRDHAA